MKRWRLVAFVIASGVIIGIFLLKQSSPLSAVRDDAVKGSENTLVIGHADVFRTLERPAVVFDHGLHESELKAEGCRACHHPDAEGNFTFEHPFPFMPSDRKAVREAYHGLCISCHSKRMNEGKKYGPVICGECHDRRRVQQVRDMPQCAFDFFYHDKHVVKLGRKCDPCHHTYDSGDRELVYEEGTEQSCHYCHDVNAKRGPFLGAEIEVTKNKNLTLRKVSHRLCVNCHLSNSDRGRKAGPTRCAECHTGRYRTTAQLRDVPRPGRGQPKRALIAVEGRRMKGVSFSHEFHAKSAPTCRSCHHETLRACSLCHTLTGSPDGKGITTAQAYHNIFSKTACAGCHAAEKAEKNCAGCHYNLPPMDTQTKGPKKESCSICHGGKEVPVRKEKIQYSGLLEKKVPDKVTIKVLENEYQPSTFPHLKIIKRLIDISNDNMLASAFHKNVDSICLGCHHQSFPEAEEEKSKPPYCRNCHSIGFDSQNMNRPRLLAAYHRQCLGCHERMEIKQTGCNDCHEEKSGGKVLTRQMVQGAMASE